MTSVDTLGREDAVSRRDLQHLDWSTPHTVTPAAAQHEDHEAQEAFSPARRVLPGALLVLVLSVVAIGYAVVLESATALAGTLVVCVTVLGAVCGLSVRDGRDRWVTATRALGDGLRRLGRALWH